MLNIPSNLLQDLNLIPFSSPSSNYKQRLLYHIIFLKNAFSLSSSIDSHSKLILKKKIEQLKERIEISPTTGLCITYCFFHHLYLLQFSKRLEIAKRSVFKAIFARSEETHFNEILNVLFHYYPQGFSSVLKTLADKENLYEMFSLSLGPAVSYEAVSYIEDQFCQEGGDFKQAADDFFDSLNKLEQKHQFFIAWLNLSQESPAMNLLWPYFYSKLIIACQSGSEIQLIGKSHAAVNASFLEIRSLQFNLLKAQYLLALCLTQDDAGLGHLKDSFSRFTDEILKCQSIKHLNKKIYRLKRIVLDSCSECIANNCALLFPLIRHPQPEWHYQSLFSDPEVKNIVAGIASPPNTLTEIKALSQNLLTPFLKIFQDQRLLPASAEFSFSNQKTDPLKNAFFFALVVQILCQLRSKMSFGEYLSFFDHIPKEFLKNYLKIDSQDFPISYTSHLIGIYFMLKTSEKKSESPFYEYILEEIEFFKSSSIFNEEFFLEQINIFREDYLYVFSQNNLYVEDYFPEDELPPILRSLREPLAHFALLHNPAHEKWLKSFNFCQQHCYLRNFYQFLSPLSYSGLIHLISKHFNDHRTSFDQKKFLWKHIHYLNDAYDSDFQFIPFLQKSLPRIAPEHTIHILELYADYLPQKPQLLPLFRNFGKIPEQLLLASLSRIINKLGACNKSLCLLFSQLLKFPRLILSLLSFPDIRNKKDFYLLLILRLICKKRLFQELPPEILTNFFHYHLILFRKFSDQSEINFKFFLQKHLSTIQIINCQPFPDLPLNSQPMLTCFIKHSIDFLNAISLPRFFPSAFALIDLLEYMMRHDKFDQKQKCLLDEALRYLRDWVQQANNNTQAPRLFF